MSIWLRSGSYRLRGSSVTGGPGAARVANRLIFSPGNYGCYLTLRLMRRAL